MLNPKSKIQNPKSEDPGREVDRELARRIGEGDREALADWLDRHLDAVYRYAARRLGPGYEDVAADVARATFGDAFRRLGPYARGAASVPMRLWLLKLAGQRLDEEHIVPGTGDQGLGTRDQGWGIDPPADPIPTPASGYPRSPVLDTTGLREVLGQLPRRQQTVMSLALFEGMAAEEIGAASGLGRARSMRELRRALKRTGRLLESLRAGSER